MGFSARRVFVLRAGIKEAGRSLKDLGIRINLRGGLKSIRIFQFLEYPFWVKKINKMRATTNP